jgi:hypothetical protein
MRAVRTMNLIECRSCDEPDCTGCNLHRLALALRRGLFDACKDNHNAVCITSEVAPVVHGGWIQINGHRYCNVCGHKDSPILTKYCPNCGAKMDGGIDK